MYVKLPERVKPVTDVGSNWSSSTPVISSVEYDLFLGLIRRLSLPLADGRRPSRDRRSRSLGMDETLRCKSGIGFQPLCRHIPSCRPKPSPPYVYDGGEFISIKGWNFDSAAITRRSHLEV